MKNIKSILVRFYHLGNKGDYDASLALAEKEIQDEILIIVEKSLHERNMKILDLESKIKAIQMSEKPNCYHHE